MPKFSPSKRKNLSKKAQLTFLAQLNAAVAEKDAESAYKSVFQQYYDTTFPSPYGSDGYIELGQASLFGDGMRLLLEAKFGLDLTRPNERAKIVAQSIYYLKKFELDGKQLPNVILGGDENQMFTVYAPKLYPYLARDYNWTIAPSSVWQQNEELYRDLLEDPNLNVFVFDIRSAAFDINEVFRSIDALSHNDIEFHKIRVSEANIRTVFDEFVRVMWGNEWMTGVKKLGAQETVSVFIQSILANPDVYIVPTKRNMLHLSGGKEITINASNYDAFFSRYDRKYTVKEIDAITAIADQLIEEINRRFHGDFWTPTIWADRAIQMMDKDLGEGWRDKYVVWDPAAGTKNLTRDYRFANLYSSTIHQAEIDMSTQYNREATVFQYDFLNDDIDVNSDSDPRDLKMPESLFQALKNNEPIVFYTNPPYGQATEQGETSKADVANTEVGKLMRNEDLGLASAELYTQFIYRVQKLARDFELTDVHFFFFNKAYLTSPAFGKFSDALLEDFRFNGGFMLNAGEFQGTSSAWGIVFSNMSLKTDRMQAVQYEFNVSVEESGMEGVSLVTTHTLRRVNKQDTISNWVKEIELTRMPYKGGAFPRATGGFNVSRGKTIAGFLRDGAIGFMHNGGDSVQFSDKYTNLNTTMNFVDHGISVLPKNFERICVTFSSRKSILKDASWINDKDVFRRPSDAFQVSSQWPEFVNDCVVFSLFHRASYQTALRNFEYNGEMYDVANEWFYLGRDEVMELAEKYDIADIIYDARGSDERFVYRYLADKKLSPEATELLTAGRELTRATFAKRYIASQEHPEWHLMAWDAGYYQSYKITTMFKEEFSGVMLRLDTARRALETKIRERVYADGILEK